MMNRMNIPSKAINVTELNCHKNNKVEIIAAVSTDKRTVYAAFVGAEMESLSFRLTWSY